MYAIRSYYARQMLVASARRWALMTENDVAGEPSLDALVKRLDPESIDMVLVEGYKHIPFARIELHRPALRHVITSYSIHYTKLYDCLLQSAP